MSHVTTHVLDSSVGRPAARVAVELQDATGHRIAAGVTDADGRVATLGPDLLAPGPYRLVFATEPYFAASGTPTFYPQVTLDFAVTDESHYHVPLLLSPFAYSTYRGS
ncbi:5-hydroxyisourate hydrolase [Frondihabitans sp. PAMC 28766]|uniref:hydroxyisourate hydrolase n=1 Tax=Frondihabitans sp. PAMC 28766 TaxID=1795630 RepID=UPI00078EB7D6|nr:hydroxyisourate hydrolase [Frondihabitans sp. PAMC 28766]AMM19303.1 5-hydroxyisourate hydrolase [Frondihabitans sp. PAMC 28766]